MAASDVKDKAGAERNAAKAERRNGNTVDGIPPVARLFPLGLQHVLAMYAGAVAVPLIVGGALGYSSADLAFLISADLFVAGIATIIQSVGLRRFGVRLPLMQGVTFAAVGPDDRDRPERGHPGCLRSHDRVRPVHDPRRALFFFSQLLRFFPPIVTGTVILIIGLTLMRVAAGWIIDGAEGGGRRRSTSRSRSAPCCSSCSSSDSPRRLSSACRCCSGSFSAR